MKNERAARPGVNTVKKLYERIDWLEKEVVLGNLREGVKNGEVEYEMRVSNLLRKNLKTVSRLSAFLAFLILVNLGIVIKHNLAYHGNIIASKGHR